MKNNLFLIGILFFIVNTSSCVSLRPQYATIQDGIRCPLPSQKIASNTNPSKRAPASIVAKPNHQTCDQLFNQQTAEIGKTQNLTNDH